MWAELRVVSHWEAQREAAGLETWLVREQSLSCYIAIGREVALI